MTVYYWEQTAWPEPSWTEGAWEGGESPGTMNLNHWADEAWAAGSWVPSSWGSTTPVVTTIDTHDGARKRNKEFKERHETLREQLRQALEGPQAKELTHELESIATPQLADSRLIALADRIDYSGMREEIIAEILERHRARQDKEEEEIVILMALS